MEWLRELEGDLAVVSGEVSEGPTRPEGLARARRGQGSCGSDLNGVKKSVRHPWERRTDHASLPCQDSKGKNKHNQTPNSFAFIRLFPTPYKEFDACTSYQDRQPDVDDDLPLALAGEEKSGPGGHSRETNGLVVVA